MVWFKWPVTLELPLTPPLVELVAVVKFDVVDNDDMVDADEEDDDDVEEEEEGRHLSS